MLKYRRSKCTGETIGHVARFKAVTSGAPAVVWVEYIVDDQAYTKKETVKLNVAETIKVKGVSIGRKRTSKLHSLSIGVAVTVCYNPRKPKQAYLKDNVGIINQ